jgi:nucleoside phosphorylase
MMSFLPPNSRRDFDVAIICALQIEADAAEALFDHFWDENGDRYGKSRGDQNAYRTGVIGNHNAVLAYMPGIGKSHAASVAAGFRSSFQNIRLTLIVGICGGIPDRTSDGIFLGDIVITDEIVVYDLGRRFPGGFRRKKGMTDPTVNIEVRAFMQKLKSQKGREHLLRRTSHHFTGLKKRDLSYNCPGRLRDRLFENTYNHKHHSPSRCKKCEKDELCRKAQESTCETLNCDEKRLVARSRFPLDRLDIHFGRIASGDTVMKSAVERDRIAQEEGVIAFEMEGAGICINLPFIMVKGVCDYADSHKDKKWQKYTAGRAAACMRSVLEQWAAIDPHDGCAGQQTNSLQAISYRLDTISEVTPSHPLLTEESHSSQQSQDNISEKLLQGRDLFPLHIMLVSNIHSLIGGHFEIQECPCLFQSKPQALTSRC